jgi:hypothetical protein
MLPDLCEGFEQLLRIPSPTIKGTPAKSASIFRRGSKLARQARLSNERALKYHGFAGLRTIDVVFKGKQKRQGNQALPQRRRLG